MKIQIITLFPEMFEGVFDHSMLYKAQDKNLVDISYINLRGFGLGPRKQVDDKPYGGGDGMLLMVEPLSEAIKLAKENDSNAKVLLLTPRGKTYTQADARKYSKEQGLILVCGRYEGFDERIAEFVDDQVSIGNYVLTGGEIPAMAIVDSVTRLIPGVLGGETSAEIESFSDDNSSEMEFPQYTRPEDFKGMTVPDVLLSGNHGEIEKWRSNQVAKTDQ